MEILNSCVDCDEIQFKEDGSWAPMISKKVVQEVSASSNGLEGTHCDLNFPAFYTSGFSWSTVGFD